MNLHPERARRTLEQQARDPAAEWHEIYQRLVLWELPAEARLGFQLAFYRPFAVPRMAKILAETGHFRRDTTRRAYDTGLVIHEIIAGGPDSPRGQRMVRLMNALHDRPDIRQEDLTYILNALIVIPTRFMDRHGWRLVSDSEREATWRFYHQLGERMKITKLPSSYTDAETMLDAYEADQLQPSPEGLVLTASAIAALRDRLPRPIRAIAAQITGVLVGDDRARWALGLPAPRGWLTGPVRLGSALRRARVRQTPPPREPSFRPGQPAGSVYPHGYTLDQLGPKVM